MACYMSRKTFQCKLNELDVTYIGADYRDYMYFVKCLQIKQHNH